MNRMERKDFLVAQGAIILARIVCVNTKPKSKLVMVAVNGFVFVGCW